MHNTYAWNSQFKNDDHVIGVMFAGRDEKSGDDAVFIGINAYWETCSIELPKLPDGYVWHVDFYTNVPYKSGEDHDKMISKNGSFLTLAPRSAVAVSLKKL